MGLMSQGLMSYGGDCPGENIREVNASSMNIVVSEEVYAAGEE